MPHRGIERTDRWKLLSKVRDDTSSTKFILREKKGAKISTKARCESAAREVSASRDLSCVDEWWKIRVQALKMGLSFSASRGNTNSPSSCTAASSFHEIEVVGGNIVYDSHNSLHRSDAAGHFMQTRLWFLRLSQSTRNKWMFTA